VRSELRMMDKRIESRLLRAEEITKNVMVVEEDKVYAVRSQFRDGKAHVVSLKPSIGRVRINGDLILEARNIHNISNCSYRHEEYAKRAKDLIFKLGTLKPNITNVYSCSCPDLKFSGLKTCKHIMAVQIIRGERITE
jgi:hypothetical protein